MSSYKGQISPIRAKEPDKGQRALWAHRALTGHIGPFRAMKGLVM
jgi:hypothetical protein